MRLSSILHGAKSELYVLVFVLSSADGSVAGTVWSGLKLRSRRHDLLWNCDRDLDFIELESRKRRSNLFSILTELISLNKTLYYYYYYIKGIFIQH